MMQPTITLTHTQTQPIGVEAELRLMTATFKSKHGDFHLLKESNQEPNQEPTNQEPNHVYNPKSNAFGALSQKHPKQSNQSNQSNQKSFQPQTMAERLKNPERLKKAVTTVAPTTPTTTTFKVKFADLPPKSQFWWQDLDD